jgi:hypothetical protein
VPSWTARVALSAIELPIAVGLGFAAFWGVFAAGCSISHCVDMSGVPWALLGIVVGPVLGIGYWIVALRMGTRFRRRLVLDGLALTIAICAYLVPLLLPQFYDSRSTSSAGSTRIVAPDNGRKAKVTRQAPSPTTPHLEIESRPR